MAAKAKVIVDPILINTAKKVMEGNTKMVALKTDIEAIKTKVEALKTDVEKGKDELKDESRRMFFEDLGTAEFDADGNPKTISLEKEPDVSGNHEYSTTEGLLSVNFKTDQIELNDIDKTPARNYLTGVFREHFKKLFVETDKDTVDPYSVEMHNKAVMEPEKYRYALRPELTQVQMKDLAVIAAAHPDLIQEQPNEMAVFKSLNPTLVKTVSVITPAKGFIEKLAKVEANVLKNAQVFLVGFFQKAINISVSCGNAAKNSV
jgi:hypothetical protein